MNYLSLVSSYTKTTQSSTISTHTSKTQEHLFHATNRKNIIIHPINYQMHLNVRYSVLLFRGINYKVAVEITFKEIFSVLRYR